MKAMAQHSQFTRPICHVVFLCMTTMLLSACGSSSDKITFSSEKSVHDAVDAATGPLDDLNVKQIEIPPLLQKVAEDPYRSKKPIKCEEIRKELAELEVLLGPDIKAKGVKYASNESILSDVQNVEIPDTTSIANSGIDLARGLVMGAIRSQTNILPFRSIIRRITGANRHQREVEEAYFAGKLRRAYLKGLAESSFGKKCLSKPLELPKNEEDSSWFDSIF